MENASKALIVAGAILISILLITIGIVLINSGRNVVNSGTTQMASQTIQAFNSQFLPYEGRISGSQVKELLSVARASNANDSAHPVAIISAILSSYNEIIASKNYVIKFIYGKDIQDIYECEGRNFLLNPDNTKFGSHGPDRIFYNGENGYICVIIIAE